MAGILHSVLSVTIPLVDVFSVFPSTVCPSPSASTRDAGDLGVAAGDHDGTSVVAIGASGSAMTDGEGAMLAAASETVSIATSSSSAGTSCVTSHWIMLLPANVCENEDAWHV